MFNIELTSDIEPLNEKHYNDIKKMFKGHIFKETLFGGGNIKGTHAFLNEWHESKYNIDAQYAFTILETNLKNIMSLLPHCFLGVLDDNFLFINKITKNKNDEFVILLESLPTDFPKNLLMSKDVFSPHMKITRKNYESVMDSISGKSLQKRRSFVITINKNDVNDSKIYGGKDVHNTKCNYATILLEEYHLRTFSFMNDDMYFFNFKEKTMVNNPLGRNISSTLTSIFLESSTVTFNNNYSRELFSEFLYEYLHDKNIDNVLERIQALNYLFTNMVMESKKIGYIIKNLKHALFKENLEVESRFDVINEEVYSFIEILENFFEDVTERFFAGMNHNTMTSSELFDLVKLSLTHTHVNDIKKMIDSFNSQIPYDDTITFTEIRKNLKEFLYLKSDKEKRKDYYQQIATNNKTFVVLMEDTVLKYSEIVDNYVVPFLYETSLVDIIEDNIYDI